MKVIKTNLTIVTYKRKLIREGLMIVFLLLKLRGTSQIKRKEQGRSQIRISSLKKKKTHGKRRGKNEEGSVAMGILFI